MSDLFVEAAARRAQAEAERDLAYREVGVPPQVLRRLQALERRLAELEARLMDVEAGVDSLERLRDIDRRGGMYERRRWVDDDPDPDDEMAGVRETRVGRALAAALEEVRDDAR